VNTETWFQLARMIGSDAAVGSAEAGSAPKTGLQFTGRDHNTALDAV
jgi:hypothetical protein